MLFRRHKNGNSDAAVADRRKELIEADELAAAGRLDDAVALLAEANRAGRDPELETTIRELRKRIGIELTAAAERPPAYPDPSSDLPAVGPSRVPEATREQLTPEVLRGAILEYGCLLVRGLIDPDKAGEMANGIQRAYDVRDALDEGESDPDGLYDELQVEPPHVIVGRPWVGESGGMFAAVSPQLMFQMIDLFDEAGLGPVVEGYLGERPVVSAEKCTLRRTTADLPKAWHQDGKFMGDVRAINLWLSLSRCGDVAPGLDIVPRRIEDLHETGGEGTIIEIEVPQAKAEELAGPEGVSRPIFEPGDALLFDDLFLHSTGSDESMTETRYAIESWFFAPSAFPKSYVPVAL